MDPSALLWSAILNDDGDTIRDAVDLGVADCTHLQLTTNIYCSDSTGCRRVDGCRFGPDQRIG